MNNTQFLRRITLLQVSQPPDWTNDTQWLTKYAHTVDTHFLHWMSQDPSPQSQERYRQFVRPYLLLPWSVELDSDLAQRHAITPQGILNFIEIANSQ